MDSQFDRERGVTPARSHAELPLPVVPLPRPNTNPRPWDVEVEVRQFYKTTESGRLILTSGTSANKIQVTPGTVNGVIPTLSAVALNNDPAPELTITGDTWVWLKCVGVFSGPTYTVTVETSGTNAPPAGTSISTTGFTSYRLVGSVSLISGSAVIGDNRSSGDLAVESFGSANFWWVT